MSNEKRVVITGMGIVSSIGNNVEEVKNSLINQKSGIISATEDFALILFQLLWIFL